MLTITLGVCSILSIFALLLVTKFTPMATDRASQPTAKKTCEAEHATVILCLRGADPSLRNCLDGLLNQDYANYTVKVVVDAESDPSQNVLQDVAATSDRFIVEVLRDPPANRGLKVSAILQALRSLPARTKLVAFIDADTIPHRTWLSELTAPLDDPLVGVTTGTRWFCPKVNNLGSAVRAEWNLYAVAIMRYFSIPWGGSFALRREVLEGCGIIERWQTTICEDTCLGDAVQATGLRVEVVPTVSIMNDESCSLAGAMSFITRQLFFGRLHSRARIPILIFSTGMPACSILALLSALSAGAMHEPECCVLALTVLLLYYASVIRFESSWARSLRSARTEVNQKPVSWLGMSCLPLSQFSCALVATAASVIACVTRRITWRGITYRVTSQSTVEMVSYRPFNTKHIRTPMRIARSSATTPLQESFSI